ncbi:sulfate transporter 1 [Rhynchospora pubera]|uniref:Sulfate transporter 1 n=1 Tax=Rhynchospora pubera TaxID=906938 RepID=A0AAV8GEW4_9POAL|nr:sulfate transporter 1 [Rhynchospora pubera]
MDGAPHNAIDICNDDNSDQRPNSPGMEAVAHKYKVLAPPKQSTVKKIKWKLKETFFPDDPFKNFKGQPARKKCLLAVKYFFPILDWLPRYKLSMFKSDLLAGLTVASLAIPQGISYAKLANLPPIIGLYSSFIPPLVYAVLGSSRGLAVGPISIASLIMGGMLSEAVNPYADPALFLQLAFTSTLFAGVFQASLGILRLGFIIDFLSKATLVGFMAGAAVIVSLQQLKGLLGITHFPKKMGVVPVMKAVVRTTNEWSWQTILMGACFLSFLLFTRHLSIKKPKLFWISAGAPLASVIISTLFVFIFNAQDYNIQVIGKLKSGLNGPSLDRLLFDGTYLGVTMETGLVTGIIALTEGVAVGRAFASLNGYHIDGNKEMMAIGLMNIVGSCTSCYVTTGAFSRSAVNHNAGCKTPMSNVVMAITVMVTLLLLMPLFAYTPNAVLAAIIISAVIGLIDIQTAYHIYKMDKVDFLVCISGFLGVIFISVQGGLGISVGLSIFRILFQITRPKIAILGNIQGTDIYRNLHQYKEAQRIPGFIILSVEAPINFANTNYLHERIRRWIEEEQSAESKDTNLQYIILDLSSVLTVDTSGIAFFMDLKKTIAKYGLQLVFVNPVGEVMEKLQRANKLHDFFGIDSLFLTISEAVISLSSFIKLSP